MHGTSLRERWTATGGEGGYFSVSGDLVDLASNTEYYRIWSMLNFMFCMECAPEEGESVAVANLERFGHGFNVTGCMFLYLLEQLLRKLFLIHFFLLRHGEVFFLLLMEFLPNFF